MTTITCAACGSENPAELELCQNCGVPLPSAGDWLAELSAGQSGTPDPEPGTTAPAELPDPPAEGEAPPPDWLAALMPEETWPAADVPEPPESLAEDTPEPAADAPPPEDEPPIRRAGGTRELRGIPEPLASENLPDWLEDQAEDAFWEVDAGDAPASEAEPEIPDWLASLGPAGETSDEPDSGGSLGGADSWLSGVDRSAMPDWLKPDQAETPPAADLPHWLADLRSPGKLAGGDDLAASPDSGPLKGLPGVIAAAAAVDRAGAYARPKPLELTKEQQQQVAILRQLAQGEPERPRPVGMAPATALHAAARLLIAAVLLAAVLLGLLVLLPDNLAPGAAAVELAPPAVTAYEQVAAVAGRPVLVAFDYAPAMAGELDAVGEAFLRHLAAGGSPVLTISRSPAGAALADRLTARVPALERVSLGFLPGEELGLRGIGACLPPASQGCEAAVRALAQPDAAARLNQVALVVILAGDRDGLIGWAEQVAPQSDVPLVAGVSQALGPIAAPYLTTGALQGAVAGLPAAAAYEVARPGPDAAFTAYLPAYGLARVVAVAVLLLAAVYYGLRHSVFETLVAARRAG